MKPQLFVHLAYVNSIKFLQGVSVEAVDPVFQAKMLGFETIPYHFYTF